MLHEVTIHGNGSGVKLTMKLPNPVAYLHASFSSVEEKDRNMARSLDPKYTAIDNARPQSSLY